MQLNKHKSLGILPYDLIPVIFKKQKSSFRNNIFATPNTMNSNICMLNWRSEDLDSVRKNNPSSLFSWPFSVLEAERRKRLEVGS
jgi:hypothetical protein